MHWLSKTQEAPAQHRRGGVRRQRRWSEVSRRGLPRRSRGGQAFSAFLKKGQRDVPLAGPAAVCRRPAGRSIANLSMLAALAIPGACAPEAIPRRGRSHTGASQGAVRVAGCGLWVAVAMVRVAGLPIVQVVCARCASGVSHTSMLLPHPDGSTPCRVHTLQGSHVDLV